MNEGKQKTSDDQQDRIIRNNVRTGSAIAFGALLIIFLIGGMYAFVSPSTPTEKKDFVQAVVYSSVG